MSAAPPEAVSREALVGRVNDREVTETANSETDIDGQQPLHSGYSVE